MVDCSSSKRKRKQCNVFPPLTPPCMCYSRSVIFCSPSTSSGVMTVFLRSSSSVFTGIPMSDELLPCCTFMSSRSCSEPRTEALLELFLLVLLLGPMLQALPQKRALVALCWKKPSLDGGKIRSSLPPPPPSQSALPSCFNPNLL